MLQRWRHKNPISVPPTNIEYPYSRPERLMNMERAPTQPKIYDFFKVKEVISNTNAADIEEGDCVAETPKNLQGQQLDIYQEATQPHLTSTATAKEVQKQDTNQYQQDAAHNVVIHKSPVAAKSYLAATSRGPEDSERFGSIDIEGDIPTIVFTKA